MLGWQAWKPMSIEELMSPVVHWVGPDATVQEVATLMRDKEIGAVPVVDLGRLVGMITDRDITCRAVADGASPFASKVREIMTPTAVYCYVDQPVADAAWMMREKGVRRLPVFTRENRMIGVLAISDIARDFPILSGKILETTRKAEDGRGRGSGQREEQPKARRGFFGRSKDKQDKKSAVA